MKEKNCKFEELIKFHQDLQTAIEHASTIMELGDNPYFDQNDDQIEENKTDEELLINNISDDDFKKQSKTLNLEQTRLTKYFRDYIMKEVNNFGSLENLPKRVWLFLTGGGGVGKSYTLKHTIQLIIRLFKIVDPQEKYVKIAAPTGTAACKIGAQTLHSLLKIPVQKDCKIPKYAPLTGIYLEKNAATVEKCSLPNYRRNFDGML